MNHANIRRCAIYTRKSTDHNLDLEFNSLDAQREACRAFVKSQAAEGWRVIPKSYDDPAYSGGSIERPGLQRLLSDIESGLIDVVVIYKIDRLTRSLTDFVKLLERFEARSVSLVAVTQQFNSTTPMGRLTLNVLLSFAQFERELASERVRDKISASRRKGKWTGGNIPLGYDTREKKLVPNEKEAEQVRYIFSQYLKLKAINTLIAHLNKKGFRTKLPSKKLRTARGNPFTFGPLAYVLRNRIYIGQVRSGKEWHRGEHIGIVSKQIFDRVQKLLDANAINRKELRVKSEALLRGILYDDRGNRMSPSFTTKKGVRYRFYVSSALLRGKRKDVGNITRISAPKIEESVVHQLRNRFKDTTTDQATLISLYVEKIRLGPKQIDITLKPKQRGRAITHISVPWTLRSPSSSSIDFSSQRPDSRNPVLIQAIVQAHRRLRILMTEKSIERLGSKLKADPRVIRENIRFAFLAPSITEMILKGRQPRSLTLKQLKRAAAVPSWSEQQPLLALQPTN